MGIENPVHLIFLAAVALVVLGPKRLPELARAAGKGMREFRESLNGEGSEEEPAGAAVVQPVAAPQLQQVPPQQASPQQASPQQASPQQPRAQLLSGASEGPQPAALPPDSPV
jgi:sec-independent protein translocase protein TatA